MLAEKEKRFPGIWRFSSLSLVEIRLMVSPDRYILKILSTMDASSGTISGSPSAPFAVSQEALIVEYGLAPPEIAYEKSR